MAILQACFFLIFSAAGLSAQSQRVTVKADNATVGTVIQSLKQQTGMDFFYSNAQIDVNRRVTLDLDGVELGQAMRRLLGDGFSFEYNDNVVVVKPAAAASAPPAISGTVTGADGKPIVGASVYVKGNSRLGTISDAQGNYKLSLTGSTNPVITVSFIGMEPYEFTPAGATQNVTLKEAANQITAVTVTVNTGYQDIPRDRMTGAYSTVTAKELENSTFMSLDQALQGKVAGLFASTPSGEPGVQSEIRIRGDNSISGNNEPLWIVDGLPLQQGVATISGLSSGNLQESILDHGVGNISPSDIESVTILKDAAATAIYGARAAAGVIVIKTIKGSQGPVSISYQGNFSLGEAPGKTLNFMNAAEKVQYEIELVEQFGSASSLGTAAWKWNAWQRGDISTEEYRKTLADMSAVNVDWFDEIYRMSFSHKHNLSMRGGNDKMWFYGSLNATDDKGILKSNRYNAFSGSVSVGYRPAEKVSVDFKLEGHYRESNNHNSAIDPFKYAVFVNPYEKVYNDDGSYAWDTSYLSGYSPLHQGKAFEKFNILNEMDRTGKKSIATDLTATLSLTWQITEYLKAEAYGRVGYSVSQTDEFAGKGTYTSNQRYLIRQAFKGSETTEIPDAYNNGYKSGSTSRSPSYSMRAGLAYNRDINMKHYFNFYAGTEVRSSESWSDSYRTVGYDDKYSMTSFPEMPWNPILDKYLAAELSGMSGYVYGNKKRYLSFFGAFTYSYDDRYVANFNARFDGASAMHKAENYTPLWSASLRWNLHRENFIKDNLPFISELAIRGVYGFTGQIDISALPYPYIRLASPTGNSSSYDSEYVAAQVFYPNPGIKWEKKRERSIGLDYSLFNNVFGGSVNYYNNKTEDLLDKSSVANSFGNIAPKMNKGSLTNKGFEFHFNLRLRFNENLRWMTSFNIARNTNKITDTYYKSPQAYFKDNPEDIQNVWRGFSSAVEDYPVGTVFGYRFADVDPDTGNARIYITDETRKIIADAKGKDISEIGDKWDVEDMGKETAMPYSLTRIGNTNPKYYGGFNTTLQWKNLEFRASFSYATDIIAQAFNERSHSYSTTGNDVYVGRLNRLKTAANRWRVPGDITNYPAYSLKNSTYYMILTDDKFEKAGYLKFQDISVNYNLKAPFMKAAGISSMRVGFVMSNIAVWSKFSGFDASTGSAFAYPMQRRYTLNLQLSF